MSDSSPTPVPADVAERLDPCSKEAERDGLVLRKLGWRGCERLHHFRHYYSHGWGERGQGRPLSSRSLEAFFRFLEIFSWRDDQPPRLYLTDAGHLELCWEGANSQAIQVEFGPSSTEFYIEASEEEDTVPHSSLGLLVEKLARH